MIEVNAISDLITSLLAQYGLTGLAFGALLYLLWRNKKEADARITDLENKQDKLYEENISTYKEMIGEYVGLVQSKIEILSKLTSCINAMNDTLTRLENKNKN